MSSRSSLQCSEVNGENKFGDFGEEVAFSGLVFFRAGFQ